MSDEIAGVDISPPKPTEEMMMTIPWGNEQQFVFFKLLLQSVQEMDKKIKRAETENKTLRDRVRALEVATVEQSEILTLLENRTRQAVVVKDCSRRPSLYQLVDDGIELVTKK